MEGFLLLILCQIINTYYSIKQAYINKMTYTRKSLILTFFGMIIPPLFEEALFRVVYKQYFSDIAYTREINALFFGIIHSFNYRLNPHIKSIIVQILTTIYLGYFLFQFDNFVDYASYHIFFNLIIFFFTISIYSLIKKPYENAVNFYYFNIVVDDLVIGKENLYYKNVEHKMVRSNKIRKDVLKSIELFNDKIRNRKFK